MCTAACRRPRDVGLSVLALDTLAGLYGHPVVRRLAEAFRAAGGQLFVVGGPVRDALRGHADFADLDFTTSLRPAQTRQVLRAFGRTWTSGERYGTVGVVVRAEGLAQKVEVTTFRTEVYSRDSRKPTVGFGDSVLEDLQRRDLTVNAIALNVVDGCLLDLFGGIEHLAAGVLDTPDDPRKTLSEDPLRILRAIRFAAKLDAALAPHLMTAARDLGHRLAIVAAERRLEELEKLSELDAAPGLGDGLALAAELGVLDYWVPGALPEAVTRSTEALNLEEAVAGLLFHVAEPGVALREMKMPGRRIRAILTLHTMAHGLLCGPLSVPEARRLLRSASNPVLLGAERVAFIGAGSWPEISALLWDVAEHEGPGLRGPLPVTGADMLALGLRGRAIGRMLGDLEDEMCRTGNVDRAYLLRRAAVLAGVS